MNSKLHKLIVDLSRSIGQRRLYFSDHPLVRNYCVQFVENLKTLITDLGSDKLFIGIVGGRIVHDGRQLVGPSIMGQQLVDFAGKLHCGGFVFSSSTTTKEMKALLDLVDEQESAIGNLKQARELLKSRGIHNIELAESYTAPSDFISDEDTIAWQGKEKSSDHFDSPVLVYQALFGVVAKAHGNVSLDRAIDIDGAQSVSGHLLSSAKTHFTDMLQFVKYPDYDSYTVGHSVRVATLAVFVGNNLGLDDELLLGLGTAALLHDVGKSKIPSEILFKTGRLDDDEMEIMRSHAELGAEILLQHQNSSQIQIAAAFGHHIRYDGGGYPEFPSWAVRSPLVALLQICDVFEALTAVRPYKPRVTPLEAYGIMLEDKGAFDPALLQAFISTLGIYPPGNRVRLADGCEGIVVSTGSAIDKPIVRLTQGRDGTELPDSEQHLLDLAKNLNGSLEIIELLLDHSSNTDKSDTIAE